MEKMEKMQKMGAIKSCGSSGGKEVKPYLYLAGFTTLASGPGLFVAAARRH